MSTPFLSGLLSLVEADAEVGAIPAAITFLTALNSSKNALQRVAALAQFEGNLVAGESAVPTQLLGQVVPQLNAALQAQLVKAEAIIAGTPTTTPA
jgi:hypothetical protein